MDHFFHATSSAMQSTPHRLVTWKGLEGKAFTIPYSFSSFFHPLYWPAMHLVRASLPLSSSSSFEIRSVLQQIHHLSCHYTHPIALFASFCSSNTILTGIFIHTHTHTHTHSHTYSHSHTHTPSDQLSEVLPSTTVTVTFLFLSLLTHQSLVQYCTLRFSF